MAECFVGPVMEKLIDACSDYLKDQVRWQTGMKDELLKLRDINPKIQSVISAYKQAQIEDPILNKWLWQLRDAIDEADDLLDEFEYWKLEKQVKKDKKIRKVRFLMKSLKKRTVEIGKRVLKIDPNLRRLEVAVQKLSRISAEVGPFLQLLDITKQEQKELELELNNARETGSMPKNDLLGRSKEMEFVRNWLRNPYQEEIVNTDLYSKISLLSVVGHGGMGKTTLLQYIYEDGVTEEFDIKMWVCVSINFNAKTVITNMLKSLKKHASDGDPIEPLQRNLQSEVKSKRFLLVLDDIWEEDERKWENVLAPLHYGKPGSKIVITTRMDSVASMFAKMIKKSKKILPLKGLEEEKCLELFNTYAFAGVENSIVHKRLESIAREMVKKLFGCPLAAKVVGGILNFNLDESYWRKFLNHDIGNIELGQNDLLSILKLSYICLPKYLQNCFAFCCMFPQDHEFDKKSLVRMWIGLGFIQSSSIQGETLEDIGGKYFDILVRKSFFDKICHPFDIVIYKMHDLMHELAQSVSTKECLRVVGDKELSIPDTIRHLCFSTCSLATFKKMGKFKKLRSLFMSYNANCDENFVKGLSKIFRASKSIRLLHIYAPNLEKIPETIKCLIHLRYLRLNCSILKLPRSISHLYQLQFIDYTNKFNYCAYDFLPRDMNNLYNLRYLRLPLNENCMIYEIGKLKSLQELSCFYVKDEIGYGICELEHMNLLRKINIQLENIKDVEETCGAKFYDKKNLTDISLQWGDYEGRRNNIKYQDLDEKVLDSIQPYSNLMRLCITAYMGVRSPMWMNDFYLTSSNLEYIELIGCTKWQTLPPFGQLPFLKSLFLYKMPEVKQLDYNKDSMFRSLEVLHIENLEELQEWFDATAAENECLLPCLTELYMRDCPKLQELPYLSTKLQKIDMDNIGWKSCNWLPNIRNCSKIEIQNLPNLIHLRGCQESKTSEDFQLRIDKLVINDPFVLLMEPMRSISSLRFLTIEENDELVSFPVETEGWFQPLSSSLFDLRFNKLKSLQSLPSFLERLSSLNTLHVSNVPQLKLFPKLPSSIETLKLDYFESLPLLPSCLSTISSLKHLFLKDSSQLELLPDLPSSLEQLELEKLHSLQRMSSSLSTISSLNLIRLSCIPVLESLPDLPSSLENFELEELESLQCLPSSLSTISSLKHLKLKNIPLLKSLPNLPSFIESLSLEKIESLPISLSTVSALKYLKLNNIKHLTSLPNLPSSLENLELEELESLRCLPSSLSAISSLTHLKLNKIPHLESLPHLPSYLKELELEELESLQCLPASLSTVSSLECLELRNIPLLKSLSVLPSSLWSLYLEELDNLDCLPSCLPTTLHVLAIIEVPRLKVLPDLPVSLELLRIKGNRLRWKARYRNIARLSLPTVDRIENLDYFSGIFSDLASEHVDYIDRLATNVFYSM